jgi:hypothetical protein
VRRIHHHRIRKRQQLLVQAVIKQSRKFPRRVRARKIRRPTSPINNVSPVSTAHGCTDSPSDDLLTSVITRQTLSGVWPGVSKARIRTAPIFTSKPSVRRTCGNSALACAPI